MKTLNEFFYMGMDRDIPNMIDRTGNAPVILNLGHGAKLLPFYVTSVGLPFWDAENDPLPYGNKTVDEVWAFHFLEHIRNIEHVMAEVQRVLVPGGVFNITVPYGTCHMAVQDLNHVHFFNEDTWKHLFENPYYDTAQGHDRMVPWQFRVNVNCIMGVKGENLALMTQLVKE